MGVCGTLLLHRPPESVKSSPLLRRVPGRRCFRFLDIPRFLIVPGVATRTELGKNTRRSDLFGSIGIDTDSRPNDAQKSRPQRLRPRVWRKLELS